MRKFLIGSLLKELATILGAIIAGGLTWSICVVLLPKPIALIVALAVAVTSGRAIYRGEWWDSFSYSAAQRREADLALDARLAKENQKKEEQAIPAPDCGLRNTGGLVVKPRNPGNHRPKFQTKFGVAEEEPDGPGERFVQGFSGYGLATPSVPPPPRLPDVGCRRNKKSPLDKGASVIHVPITRRRTRCRIELGCLPDPGR